MDLFSKIHYLTKIFIIQNGVLPNVPKQAYKKVETKLY